MAWLELQVRDTGAGISKARLPKLFDRFSSGQDGRQRGTGLGLALVQELVSAMDGEVRVDSELGQGSVFTVTLPAALATVDLQQAPQERLDGLHLLLVDDNAVNRMVGQSLFESRGARVTLSEGGQAALGSLGEGLRPDVVITDLHMPGLDAICCPI